MRKTLMGLATGAVLVLAACGDGNDPGGELDEQEQAALVQALAAEGILDAGAAVAFGPLLGESEVGSFGDFAAVASQVKITAITEEGSNTITTVGVTGWNGLNTGNNTVAEALSVIAFEETGTFPGTVDADIGGGSAAAFYFDGATDSHYYPGTGGLFAMTGASFGGTTDCPNIPDDIPGIEITECRFATGTMQGSFDFEADRIDGSGPETFTQANTSYDLPAVQLSMTIDYTGLATARAGK